MMTRLGGFVLAFMINLPATLFVCTQALPFYDTMDKIIGAVEMSHVAYSFLLQTVTGKNKGS